MIINLQRFFASLRQRDVEELHELGLTPEDVLAHHRAGATEPWYWAHEGEIAAALWFTQATPKALGANFFATDAWPHVATEMYKAAHRIVKPRLLALGYRRAEARVMSGHDDAIRMMEHLGFTLECRLPEYGNSGRSFAQYAWTLKANNDVHV